MLVVAVGWWWLGGTALGQLGVRAAVAGGQGIFANYFAVVERVMRALVRSCVVQQGIAASIFLAVAWHMVCACIVCMLIVIIIITTSSPPPAPHSTTT